MAGAVQVVLNKDVKKLGYRGDLISVKRGYFRNFLSPQGLAEMATASVLKLVEGRKAKLTIEKEQLLDNAKDVLNKLTGLTVTVSAKASDKGKLFGSITEAEVIEAVEKATKVKLEPEFLKMDHFKELGEFIVKVHLGKGLDEEITVKVEAAE